MVEFTAVTRRGL